MEKRCSEVSENCVTHYDVHMESSVSEDNPFRARIKLSHEKIKIYRDFKDFDLVADRIKINVYSKEYLSIKRDVEESFDKYYSVVDSGLRDAE